MSVCVCGGGGGGGEVKTSMYISQSNKSMWSMYLPYHTEYIKKPRNFPDRVIGREESSCTCGLSHVAVTLTSIGQLMRVCFLRFDFVFFFSFSERSFWLKLKSLSAWRFYLRKNKTNKLLSREIRADYLIYESSWPGKRYRYQDDWSVQFVRVLI